MKQKEALELLITQLLKTNQIHNLTAVRDRETAWSKHILDSLAAQSILDQYPNLENLLDIGAGAGFPGLPIAIENKKIAVSFVEATAKKCQFIKEMILKFNLIGSVYHTRSEELAHLPAHREAYDITTTRAVGSFTEVLELTLPFLKIGGYSLLWRGLDANSEHTSHSETLSLLGGEYVDTFHYSIPEHPLEYSIVVIRKATITPKKYPRLPGIPKKNPLK